MGNVVLRAAIYIDPYTTQATDTSDPLPHILDGVPFLIGHVNVTIDRPGFTFNPTNCDPMSVTGTVTGVEGASSYLSS